MSPVLTDPGEQPGSVAPLAPLPTEPEAIFVVGASRSGTTLMRNLLERSDRIALARENHFVGHLVNGEGARYYFRRLGELANDHTISALVDFVYSGEYQRRSRVREISPYWRWLTESVPRDDFERRLLDAERTERGLFAAMMRVYADWRGRPIMGEKTPAHLAYVDTLLEWFPKAKVIHMIRDPRAVYVSDKHRRMAKRRRPYSLLMHIPLLFPAVLLLQTALVWRGAARRHLEYVTRYPERYRLVRFEDVVTRPEETLRDVFDFLGVAAPADATAVQVYAHGFRVGEEGIDAQAATRWQAHISPFARYLLTLLLGRWMKRLGYSPKASPQPVAHTAT
jgi:hypothetical protein